MMQKFISFIFFVAVLSVDSLGQHQISIDLDWYQKEVVQHDGSVKVLDYFSDGQLVSGSDDILYANAVELLGQGQVEVQLRVIDTEVVNTKVAHLGEDFAIETYVSQAGRSRFGHFTIYPYRSNHGKVERLKKGVVYVTEVNSKTNSQPRGPERTYESVLAKGNIYKIAVTKEGVYKLTFSDLEKLGLNPSTINPQNIALYTNYGGKLPEIISFQNPDDLIEIPIEVEGEADGKFDTKDVIYFYTDGPNKWQYHKSSYVYETNIYDTKNYVYIKVKDDKGARISINDGVSNPEKVSEVYEDYQVFEEDLTNLLGAHSSTEGSGQLWFGNRFNHAETYDLSKHFNLNGIAEDGIRIKAYLAGRSASENSFDLRVGTNSKRISFSGVSLASIESDYAKYGILETVTPYNQGDRIILEYKSSDGGNGWLDRVEIVSKKKVNHQGTPYTIRQSNIEQYKSYAYVIDGDIEGAEVWSIGDLSRIEQIRILNEMISFEVYNGRPNDMIVFKKSEVNSPELIGKIENQNIHSTSGVDMIVVYHELFEEAVDKYIKHRSNHSNIEIAKINIEDIYEEFASGRQDPSAMRDFIKMVYDRNDRLSYVLLFGDGSYDFRRIDKSIPDERFIPVYETKASLNAITAFPSDDYFALLSDDEGDELRGTLDIAIGRLTVTTLEEAYDVVNKIIIYDTSPSRFGDWRVRGTFTADDEDGNNHLNQVEDLIKDIVNPQNPLINEKKIYLDAYRQETTPGGQRYPEVEAAYANAMDRGNLTMCYLGHGGPKGWAQERVLKVSDINSWKNQNNLALIITATCTFAGYDDPEVKSAGEYALLNGKGGAIALFSTVRAVYSNLNEALTRSMYKYIYEKEDGHPLTFGKIMLYGKNNGSVALAQNTRKFTLIGDPSQTIALPRHDIVVNTINGVDAAAFTDTIGALEEVVLKGIVVGDDGAVKTDFNGKLFATIFDKKSTIETLGNDIRSPKKKVDVLKNILFKGVATVQDGEFEVKFIVPKDINYTPGYSKVSLYATDFNSLDAAGYYNKLVVGGSKNAIADDGPPIIDLYINDKKFESGQVVAPNFTMIADLEDDLGINVTGTGIGHDLVATLSGPDDASYVLNEYYESNLNDYRAGRVMFPFTGLEEGNYELKLKVWDVSNKSSEATISFVVKENHKELLFNVSSYPNPTENVLNIAFTHDLGATNAVVDISFYTIAGQLVGQVSEELYLNGGRQVLANPASIQNILSTMTEGMYLYKIKLNSSALKQSRTSKFEKFVKF